MNKLVIVGNGFDLAHGLPTSYKHFMEYFWSSLDKNWNQNFTKNFVEISPSKNWNRFLQEDFKNFKEFELVLLNEINDPVFPIVYNPTTIVAYNKNDKREKVFEFKNNFFKKINKISIKNWVDIENEYYKELKKISKQKPIARRGRKVLTIEEQAIENSEKVKNLNQEFEQIKLLLNKYLVRKVEKSFNLTESISNHIKLTSFFEVKPKYLSSNTYENSYLKEFPKEDYDHLLRIDNRLSEAKRDDKFQDLLRSGQATFSSIFLNFNYTSTLSSYIEILQEMYYDKVNQIHIHGSFHETNNILNFGFGDEMDEDYKFIENLNDNEYLKNFKSFKYSQNSNYKNLLNYIDSDKFQVYIMGHSCGLSDRTLLNTIFEHKNCRSIKVFYHQREDGSDNFTEIIQNISRHFNDKKEMRAKLVNKSLCEPLPQDIRFQRKES